MDILQNSLQAIAATGIVGAVALVAIYWAKSKDDRNNELQEKRVEDQKQDKAAYREIIEKNNDSVDELKNTILQLFEVVKMFIKGQ